MTRHESRVTAFCLLFEYSFGGTPEEILANAAEYREEKISAFANQLFLGAVGEIEKFDGLIKQFAENRTFSRIGKVPLAALRLGCYELLFTRTPAEVAINEALELCREFNFEESVSYVNGVLGKINSSREQNG